MVRANDENAPAPNKNLPVRFFSGVKDACMGGEKALRAAAGLLVEKGYGDVDMKLYPGMRHEICNETDKVKVFEDIAAFLDGIF